jgi:hypothetical protein
MHVAADTLMQVAAGALMRVAADALVGIGAGRLLVLAVGAGAVQMHLWECTAAGAPSTSAQGLESWRCAIVPSGEQNSHGSQWGTEQP